MGGGAGRAVFVGDRGMLTSTRIDAELRPVERLDWISALRSDGIARLARNQGPLQPSLFDTRGLAEIRHPDFPGERLIACLNPSLLAATEADLEKIAGEAARRTCTPLTAAAIGQKVGRVLGRHKMGKHFGWEVVDGGRLRYWRETEQIAVDVPQSRPTRGSPRSSAPSGA